MAQNIKSAGNKIEMNKLVKYHKTIGNELHEIKDRVRDLLCNSEHWLSDGRHKEGILRSVLERHLSQDISASNGFVRLPDQCTSEIDILLYRNTIPVLYRASDLVFVTPSAVFGGIEVKTKLVINKMDEVLSKIAKNSESISRQNYMSNWETLDFQRMSSRNNSPWFALFCYDHNVNLENFMKKLNEIANKDFSRAIKCICLGPDIFIRFWNEKRDTPYSEKSFTGWRLYRMEGLAFSYFISNMIWQDKVITLDESPWFALDDKETKLEMSQEFTLR
jgi:hypothetical protein